MTPGGIHRWLTKRQLVACGLGSGRTRARCEKPLDLTLYSVVQLVACGEESGQLAEFWTVGGLGLGISSAESPTRQTRHVTKR